jgi:hypothetical protein
MAHATHRVGPFARGAHRGLSANKALSASRATSSRVIVIMRNRCNAIPAIKR